MNKIYAAILGIILAVPAAASGPFICSANCTIQVVGGYMIATITGNSTLTVNKTLAADVVAVAGGGGGGNGSWSFDYPLDGGGGGGGAGGYTYYPNYPMHKGYDITVTIGAGGAGYTEDYSFGNGNNGANTYFGDGVWASTTVYGGGGGGGSRMNGSNGGSGGGAGGRNTTGTSSGGTSPTGQGYAGGGGGGLAYSGGGAGSAGKLQMYIPKAGCGVTEPITGTIVAGGGAGPAQDAYDSSSCDVGGAGAQDIGVDTYTLAQPGQTNRGGGGGGGGLGFEGVPYIYAEHGAAGGSGVVIVRVHMPSTGMMGLFD